ncbi:MAG: phage/plasmid primase, P4 family [Pirellulales bacterium]
MPLGQKDPKSGRLVLSPQRTLPTAEAFLRQFYCHSDRWKLVNYAGTLMEWQENRYVVVEDEAVRQRLQRWLHRALRYSPNRRTGDPELVDFDSNSATINGALEAIKSRVFIQGNTSPPAWLVPRRNDPLPQQLLPLRSSLLHLPTMARYRPTPRLLNVNALAFDHDPCAPSPERWIAFLQQLFGDDVQSNQLLQEWFGYCLTGNTSMQKMLLIVGPKRSGKGTIARVLRQLIGPGNVAGPTVSSLAGAFGLQSLLDKSLAIVSDARLQGQYAQIVAERLLCISGEDAITVDRKYLPSVTVTLPTRFVFLTNELPKFSDASGALAGRFEVIRLTNSFFGMEDKTLTDRLIAELPGILNWAIEGWRRLNERGHFITPETSREYIDALGDISSPVAAFVRECCVVSTGQRVTVDEIYNSWKRWCESEGRPHAGTKQSFGRDLAAALPKIETRRGTALQRFYEGIGLKKLR